MDLNRDNSEDKQMGLEGSLVFASGKSTDFDIWKLDLQSRELIQLTSGMGLNDQPKWSPDGTKIAFISTGPDFIASLCVMNRDGSQKQRLTTNIHCQHPSWSADGEKVVFVANAENNDEFHICVYDLKAATHQILFRRDGHETEPMLSRDGKKVLFASTDPDSQIPFSHRDTEIWQYDLATKLATKVCRHGARDYCPVYSPNEQKIAFVSHRNGRSEEDYLEKLRKIKQSLDTKSRASIDAAIKELLALEQDGDIHVVNADGTNLRQLTTNAGADTDICWSPCGNYIAYSASPADKGTCERIKVIEVETGSNVPLAYDRKPLMQEISADPDRYVNNHLFQYLIPNFIERPYMRRFISETFWGEERQPDWANK